MIFGRVPTNQAVDTILAHTLALPERRLRKGLVLTKEDVEQITGAGISEIVVARLEANDLLENIAAERVASWLASSFIEAAEPFTGRVNLHANRSGVFTADRDVVNLLNRVNPAITLATLNDGEFVEAGRMVATVKIIPFAVASSEVEKACKVLERQSALAFHPSQPKRVHLIATELPSLKTATMNKTRETLRSRLAAAGSDICCETRIGHTSNEVCASLKAAVGGCDTIIVFGASAMADKRDVIAEGLERAGGIVEYFGMPVDPGNLLLMGCLGDIPVIGAPGCARSPAENGFDWVLQRVLADLPVDKYYLTGLGVGGLLMEITSRPQPRAG